MSFTLPDDAYLECEVEHLFGIPFTKFIEASSGRSGYRKRYEYGNIDVLTDGGSSGMGHNITLKGAACHRYQRCLRDIVEHVFAIDGHFTRCDLAIDDFHGLLDMEVIGEAITGGLVTANFKKVREYNERERTTGMLTGRGAYFGSRKSEVFIRIYDKALEQRVDQHWVRVELELKGSRANAAMKLVLTKEIGTVARGILNSRLSFREKSKDGNRSRWPVSGWWKSFIASVEKLQLVADSREGVSQESRLVSFFQNAATFAELVDNCGPWVILLMYDNGKRKLERRGGVNPWAA
ncbi:replication initiation factor domain-containing protein [Geomonas limicola]|nr:replication initiation factor domain-containing protein [Geomonas limicola]